MSEVIDLLAQLVAIGSVNPMGRDLTGDDVLETRMGHFLQRWFQQEGISCERQTVEPGRDNIIARLEGGPRTVLFEAHQDVVPVDNMTIDPWEPVIENGRLQGRGSCDTKAGMAGMMTAMRRLKREAPAGAPAVIMLCVVDEEHQFRGISKACEMGIEADMAIVAEPTELEIVVSHKGVVRWKIVTTGFSVHSGNRDEGINAIVRMAKVIQALEYFHQQVLRTRTDPTLGNAALSIGCIRGGTSVNTVPNRCEIEVDRRLLPGEDPLECIVEVRAWLNENGQLDFEPLFEEPWVIGPPLQRTRDEAVIQQLAASCDTMLGSHKITGVVYGTDAPVIASAGIPTVVFGAGSIRQAHSKDEWVAIDEVEQATEVFYDFLCHVPRTGPNHSICRRGQ
jgi:acetylornithine deacetylase